MATPDHSLEQEFAQVVRDYFPRWRSHTQWTVKEGPGERWQDSTGAWKKSREWGQCHPNTQTITIDNTLPSLERTATIIHECCHAVAGMWHGQRWRTRMHHAAARASILGHTALAAALLSDVEQYAEETQKDTRDPRSLSFAAQMKDHVVGMIAAYPTWTFDAIIDEVTHLWGYPRPLLLARIPTLPRVYERAHARLNAGLPARPIPPRVWEEDEEDEQEDTCEP